jgi:hypothetical protein
MESKTSSIENQSTIPHTFSATAELDPYLPAKQDSKEHETTPYPHVTLTYAQSLDGQSTSTLSNLDLMKRATC